MSDFGGGGGGGGGCEGGEGGGEGGSGGGVARFEYSHALDEATRYGCGSLNRIFKRSPRRGEFLAAYDAFVAEVVAPSLGCGEGLVYQAEPVFRVFLPYHLAVGPRHTDASYHEQPNEINCWVPLTAVSGTNSLQVESSPGAGDFEPVECRYGELFRFRGNACEHFSCLNVSDATRVSFDFRVIRPQELRLRPVASASSDAHARGRSDYFTIGRYYRVVGDAPRRGGRVVRGASPGESAEKKELREETT